MYNRYKGNGSRPEHIPDPPGEKPKIKPVKPTPAPPKRTPKKSVNELARIIPNKLNELETEDIMLILILYLMYRESGDKELLIIMGAMYLL